ncbi:unannotated protein [freshwater metagenome]|uniref:Unannotated protein n=1 Tax=freshwater metagenome TaxID=449393 RepID=A0A6J6SWB9_9ZZZZ|nr:hypothetical protein [Actinomycetota bacterium]
MTPSPLRTRRALAAVAALPLLLLSVSACGDDSSEVADAADAVSEALDSASEAADGAVDATDEEIDAALDSLDALEDDTVLDAVGQGIVSVVAGATAYEVDGSVLLVDMDGDPAEALSKCQIALGAAGALADDPKVVLRYDGEEVDCSQF